MIWSQDKRKKQDTQSWMNAGLLRSFEINKITVFVLQTDPACRRKTNNPLTIDLTMRFGDQFFNNKPLQAQCQQKIQDRKEEKAK
jgi:hypothetical protein